MKKNPVHVVLLSGGSGSRLWPLSNAARSKQFLKVLRDDEGRPESMMQRTVRLVRRQNPDAHVTVATSAAQVDAIRLQLQGEYAFSVEPDRRDTAPAIMLAAAQVASVQGAPADATVVVMPIDTFADPAYYANVSRLDDAVQSGVADLVLLGVEPSYPSTKYGYIVPASAEGDVRPVARFTEKPDKPAASALIDQGALWNCGVFAFRLGWLMELVGGYTTATDYEDLRAAYSELPKNSFDYEVVEHATSVAVIAYAGTWKDLGTWDALCEELSEPVAGNVVVDPKTTANVHVVNSTELPLVVSGVSGVVVVASPDGILVSGKQETSALKDLVQQIAVPAPMIEQFLWGEALVLRSGTSPDGTSTTTRHLLIRPGARMERVATLGSTATWTVESGEGEAVLDGRTQAIAAGDVVRTDGVADAAVEATTELCIIEVQVVRGNAASHGLQ